MQKPRTAIGLLIAIYVVVRAVMDVLGAIDFIVERVNDPGWLSSATRFLLDPPAWIPLILGLGAIVLFMWPRIKSWLPWGGLALVAPGSTSTNRQFTVTAPLLLIIVSTLGLASGLTWFYFAQMLPKPVGHWTENRFIYDAPQPIFTLAVHPEDDGKYYRISINDVDPESFVQFKIEYDGGIGTALIVPHQNQQINWQGISRETQAGVRLAKDNTTVLKVHVPPNSDMMVVRVYALWWERPVPKSSTEAPKEPQHKTKASPLVKAISGIAEFDYSMNNGIISVGPESCIFLVGFSKASDVSIHIYNRYIKSGTNIRKIARVKGAQKGNIIRFHEHDSTSNDYTLQKGEYFILENHAGCYMQGKIIDIKDDSRGAPNDWVAFEYEINTDGSAEFTAL